MSTTRPMQTADTYVLPVPGRIWGLLQTERQEVCAALLAGPFMIYKPTHVRQDAAPVDEMADKVDSRGQEALQMRLRQIDGALDSLSDN